MPLITRPVCFISYSWDSEEHKAWVARLANELYDHSINVRLDQWDTYLGMNLPQYMESAVNDSDFVIIVCTPNYAKKANESKGGTGYEKQVITGEILTAMSPDRKFIPILRTGQPQESIPVFLRGTLYIDFRDDTKFVDNIRHLVAHMNAAQSRSCAFILGSLYATNTNALMRDPVSESEIIQFREMMRNLSITLGIDSITIPGEEKKLESKNVYPDTFKIVTETRKKIVKKHGPDVGKAFGFGFTAAITGIFIQHNHPPEVIDPLINGVREAAEGYKLPYSVFETFYQIMRDGNDIEKGKAGSKFVTTIAEHLMTNHKL